MFALKNLFYLSAPLSLLLAIPVAAEHPSPSEFIVIGVTNEGSGCDGKTVDFGIDQSSGALYTHFDNFVAGDGPKAKAAGLRTRALCKITVHIECPGWAFDMTGADFAGNLELEKGVSASIVSRWKWQDVNGKDLKGKGNVQKKLTGPYKEDFLVCPANEIEHEISPCVKKDGTFLITLSATVDAGSSGNSGYVRGDATAAGFKQFYNLNWTKC